jgi:hypothetical protein
MPKDYIHSLCFQEVALLLKHSFESLGIECDMKVNELAADRINVILGYHLLKFAPALLKNRYIPYQLEQLDEKEGWYSENIRQLLENAYELWDYSEENIEFLSRLGLTAKHLPIGYHENLEMIRHESQKDTDVLFYGSIGDRRKAIIDELSKCAKVKTLFGVYGKERDTFISRSRIILNVHYYSTKIFEAPRISYLLNNRCLVVSEISPVNPYTAVDMCLVPYDKIVETCRHFLNHPVDMERARNDTYARFKKNYPMVDFLKKVV